MSVRRRRITARFERDRLLREGSARFMAALETARRVFEGIAKRDNVSPALATYGKTYTSGRVGSDAV